MTQPDRSASMLSQTRSTFQVSYLITAGRSRFSTVGVLPCATKTPALRSMRRKRACPAISHSCAIAGRVWVGQRRFSSLRPQPHRRHHQKHRHRPLLQPASAGFWLDFIRLRAGSSAPWLDPRPTRFTGTISTSISKRENLAPSASDPPSGEAGLERHTTTGRCRNGITNWTLVYCKDLRLSRQTRGC